MDRVALKHLIDLGLVKMQANGRHGLTHEGRVAARAFRLLDDMLAVETGQLKTRRDVKLSLEERYVKLSLEEPYEP